MRFERVVGTAFGALRGRQLDLDPAMTVIHGPNEAGKSTLFAALYAGLVGRKVQRGRGSGPQREFRRRHKPWTGSAWRVELTIALDSGRRLHLKQNLMDCSVTVTDASTDQYISIRALEGEVGTTLENDGSFDGAQLLGLDRDAVRSTLFVGQADVLAVLRNATELQSHLQRAAASTHVDTTAQEALQRIREQRSLRVGSPHVGNRPLRALTAAVKEAGDEADSALDVRHRLLSEQATRKRKIVAAEEAGARLTELEAIAEWVEIDLLAGRALKARELKFKLAEAEEVGAPADETSTRRVAGVVERYIQRGDKPVEPTGPNAADLQAEIDGLPEVPLGPQEPEADVVQFEKNLASAISALETLVAESVSAPSAIPIDASPDELRNIADRLVDESPRLRQGLEEQITCHRADLDYRRTQHAGRIADYEAVSTRYRTAQDRYTQLLHAYEADRERFEADDSKYNRQVEAYNVARSRREASRAEDERIVGYARQTQEAAKRRRATGFAALTVGGLFAAVAVALAIGGLITIAVVLGVVSVALLTAGAVALTRGKPGDAAPTNRHDEPLPTVMDRPTPPPPPQPPTPLTDAHPGDTPGPTPELVQLEREFEGWQTQQKAHAERAALALLRLNELGIEANPDELRMIARSIDDQTDAKRRHSQHAERVEGAHQSVKMSAEAVLHRLGETTHTSSHEELIARASNALQDYKAACKHRDEQAKKAVRKPDLLGVLEQRNQRDAAYAAALKAYDAVAADLHTVAASLGREAPTEDEALEALDDWLGDQRVMADAQAHANLDVGKLEQLLAGATIEELEAEAEARRLTAPARPVHFHTDQLAQLENARHAKAAADGDVQESGRAIKDLSDAAKPVAAAVERETRATKILDNVKQLDRYLALADAHLQVAKEVAHADIAPALADTMRPWVSRVTAGRYLDITVEPEELKLFAYDANGRMAEADILSHGTTEQLFLLLRIALATHLSKVDESVPLVLDDVTVQADPERTRATLDLLLELTAEHQIVLFTQEPEVVQWATENLASSAVVAL